MNTTLKAVIVSAILGFGFSQATMAASVSNTFDVKLTVKASCEFITSPSPLDFGAQAATATNIVGSAHFSVKCTKGTAPKIKMISSNSWAMAAPGTAAGGVKYVLYSDESRKTEWNAIQGPSVDNSGNENLFTVFGQVASVGDTAGNYADTVTISLDF